MKILCAVILSLVLSVPALANPQQVVERVVVDNGCRQQVVQRVVVPQRVVQRVVVPQRVVERVVVRQPVVVQERAAVVVQRRGLISRIVDPFGIFTPRAAIIVR